MTEPCGQHSIFEPQCATCVRLAQLVDCVTLEQERASRAEAARCRHPEHSEIQAPKSRCMCWTCLERRDGILGGAIDRMVHEVECGTLSTIQGAAEDLDAALWRTGRPDEDEAQNERIARLEARLTESESRRFAVEAERDRLLEAAQALLEEATWSLGRPHPENVARLRAALADS